MIIKDIKTSPIDISKALFSFCSLNDKVKIVVDIGCGIDFRQSNTIEFVNNGYQAFYFDIRQFSKFRENINFQKICITPNNACEILKDVGNDFTLLSIDIDSYDFYVLDSILKCYSPKFIICEINEKIPPPICFSILPDKGYQLNTSHCYGASLSKFYEICQKYPYSIVDLWYNNVIFCRNDLLESRGLIDIHDLQKLYQERYLDLPDKKSFAYNKNMEHIIGICKNSPLKAIEEINQIFRNFKGTYEIYEGKVN